MLTWVTFVAWISPTFYLFFVSFGELFAYTRKRKLTIKDPNQKPELIIFQIPTIGNYQTVNQLIKSVKNYYLPVNIEYWVIVEEYDENKEKYECDRLVVVPKNFECSALYKARALEYARRLRIQMLKQGKIPSNYKIAQCDDDSLPSRTFMKEALTVDADMMVGNISPRPIGLLSTIIDYERCIGCVFFCNFFTNISKPVWGHGEGVIINSNVDQNISYTIEGDEVTSTLFLAEDMIHMHKTARKYPRIYNSRKPVYITPPQSLGDALKQRRRWTWGHICILQHDHLPLSNRIRIGIAEFFGVWVYIVAMLGVPLHHLGLITVPTNLYPILWINFLIWLGLRGYSVGVLMGTKHAVFAMLTSYITVTMNFLIQVTGILQGEPAKFEVIKKTL